MRETQIFGDDDGAEAMDALPRKGSHRVFWFGSIAGHASKRDVALKARDANAPFRRFWER